MVFKRNHACRQGRASTVVTVAAALLGMLFSAPSAALQFSDVVVPAPLPALPPSPPPRTADEAGAAGTMDLARALAIVWTENPQVLQAESALRASEFDIKSARTGYYPYFQVQASQGEGSSDSATTLFLIQPLWNGGLTAAQVDGAEAAQLLALADLNRVRLDLGQRLLDAYFSVLQADEQQRQWASYIDALRLLLASIERRARQGVAPDADVQTALTRLKQAEAGIETARALKLASTAQLESLLSATPGRVMWPGERERLSAAEIDTYSKGPTDVHPERAAALAEIKRQEATAEASKASLSPELSLQHREQVQGVEFDPTNSATLVVMQFQSANGLRGLRTFQADKERIEAARARLRAVDREVSSTLAVDRAQLAAAAMQIEAQQRAAESSAALVESFLRQFEVGRKSWLEVLNAQREANDTVLQAISLKRNFWFYNAKLALDSMAWDRLSPVTRTGVAGKSP